MPIRLALSLLAAAALVGCDDLSSTMAAWFASPTRYVVVRGDTLGEIAAAHGVTVEQLRSWNGLEGDLIEVDQVLLIYPPDDGGLEATPGRRAPRPSTARSGRPASASGDASAEAPSRVAIRVDGLAGILGADGPSGDGSGMADAAAGLGSDPRAASGSGLTERGGGLGDAGVAEGLDAEIGRRGPAPRPADDPGSPQLPRGLAVPRAKPCLAGPADVEGDHAIAVAQGLSETQLREGLEPVTSLALSCFRGARGSFDVGLSLVVACDGRVSEVDVTDAGGLPGPTLTCIRQTLGHAEFDAHARPDGVSIALPLRFEF